MPTLNMTGPFSFDSKTINDTVVLNDAGNYALGYLRNNTFIVRYVGRSDDQPVRERLLQHLNDQEIKQYSHFKYSYDNNQTNRYYKECKNYHDFGENKSLNNKHHPDAPNNSNLRCPYCLK